MSSKQEMDRKKNEAEGEDVTGHMLVADEPGDADPERKRKRKHSEGAPEDEGVGRKRKRK
jgi:hypothetical protein